MTDFTDEEHEQHCRASRAGDVPTIAALLRLLDAARVEVGALLRVLDETRASWDREHAASQGIAAERDAARAQVVELRRAGAMLANCAFNLKQRKSLDADTRKSLAESQEAWDAAARTALDAKPTIPTPAVEQNGACKCDVPNTAKDVRLLKPCAHCGQLAMQPVETSAGPMHTVCAMRTQPAAEIAKSLGARIRLCCLDRFTGGDADRASTVLDIIRNFGEGSMKRHPHRASREAQALRAAARAWADNVDSSVDNLHDTRFAAIDEKLLKAAEQFAALITPAVDAEEVALMREVCEADFLRDSATDTSVFEAANARRRTALNKLRAYRERGR
jgi:hypothetical protein